MSQISQVDIAIIGGGIAGLWTLARLKEAGYQAILLESEQLGCKQTGASQGIIHGGTKYALTGKLTHSSQSIQKMPQRWKNCLEGRGEVDLREAKKLSNFQYLWSNKSLASKLTGFFASKVMSSRMTHLSKNNYLPPFNHPNFSGEVYQLDEPVLDTASVLDTIYQQFKEYIFHFDVDNISLKENLTFLLHNAKQDNMLTAKTIILTAGEGSEHLLSSLSASTQPPKMQRRPLLMPMLKAKKSVLPSLYAHCLGASALPKMTITSHQMKDKMVWYLGGNIAEKGVGRSISEQVKEAKIELQSLMPWMDFSSCLWSALTIDRAEPKMADGSRPSEPSVFEHNNVITAWPVKLAMVPIMVDNVMDKLQHIGIKKNSQAIALNHLTQAKVSPLPWEKVTQWIA